LAAIAIPAYNSYVDKAKKTVAISTLDTIRKDFELYHIDHQEYPPEPANIGAAESFFNDGTDSKGRNVFTSFMTDQIGTDITPVSYTYNSATATDYIFKAKARDKDQTEMTLTPSDITY